MGVTFPPLAMTPSPVNDYRSRHEARLASGARLGRADAAIAYSRLGVFAAAVVVAILGFSRTPSRGRG